MRDAVRDAFVDFSSPLEGYVEFLYLDVKGLVTTGMGNLVDPVDAALDLPFVRTDGSPASREEIRDAWLAVKARQDLAPKGGMIFRSLTTLRLTKEGVTEVVAKKLAQNDAYLRSRFGAGYDEWPADAQLATHSMSWACGPAFRFPRLEAALRAKDFALAAGQCTINPNIGTIVKRNAANELLYRNAARVLSLGLDPETLYYPRDLATAEAPTAPELPTEPEPFTPADPYDSETPPRDPSSEG